MARIYIYSIIFIILATVGCFIGAGISKDDLLYVIGSIILVIGFSVILWLTSHSKKGDGSS
jgi:energy-coupling factor transporter transmembrane protein EcfT